MEIVIMNQKRTELHREVVEALVSSKAVNFEAVGSVLAKYGARGALSGESIGVIINWRMIDACIPVDFHSLLRGVSIEHAVGGQLKG
jgi:hypothetical protein